MTAPTDIEQIGFNGPTGSLPRGNHRIIIQSVGATKTLVAKDSGALCVNDVATGIVWTLPTPVEGMQFDFCTTVSRTSTNSYKVITSASTVFLLGAVMSGDSTIATSGDIFTADGTATRSIVCNSDVKGGLIGEFYRLVALSTTIWHISGLVIGTGTMVDPFATS